MYVYVNKYIYLYTYMCIYICTYVYIELHVDAAIVLGKYERLIEKLQLSVFV
jgi:hypothetical protein